MYEELVKRLRTECTLPFQTLQLMREASNAIEQLIEERDAYRKAMTDEHNKAARLLWDKEHCWIPVEERLPGEFGRYLCRFRVEEGETIGYCTDFGRYDPEHGEWFVGTVTHWMPLPEPPKEET